MCSREKIEINKSYVNEVVQNIKRVSSRRGARTLQQQHSSPNLIVKVVEKKTTTFCVQLEETQTKRHDQLVEQHNELLQEIQDQKPKVASASPLLHICFYFKLKGSQQFLAAAAFSSSPTRLRVAADVSMSHLKGGRFLLAAMLELRA